MKFTWVPDSSDNELECPFFPKYLSVPKYHNPFISN